MNKLQEKAQELKAMAEELGVEVVIQDHFSNVSVYVDFIRHWGTRTGETMKAVEIRSWITFTETGKVRVESHEVRTGGKKISYKNLREWVAFIPELESSHRRLLASIQANS